jgi:poly(3-hydroxybutyrate) depolymerase
MTRITHCQKIIFNGNRKTKNPRTLLSTRYCTRIKALTATLLLTALVATPAFAGLTYHQILAASGTGSKQRNFDYYVPSSYVAGKAAPLWVALHDCRTTDSTMTDLLGTETHA